MPTKIKQPQKWLFPNNISKEYQRLLFRMVKQWRAQASIDITPKLPSIVGNANNLKSPIASDIISDSIDIRNDDWIDDIKKMMSNFALKIASIIPSRNVISNIASGISAFNNKQWKKIVNGSLGVDYTVSELWLNTQIKGFVDENITLITKLQSETASDIESIVIRGIQQGKRHETIAQEIMNGTKLQKGRFKKSETRARLIARDQTNKLNGQLQQQRQADIGVTRYIWKTSRDERVRPTHANMESRICVWHNSSVYIGADNKQHPRSGINGVEAHPGQPIQCRCNASPDFASIKDLDLII